MALLAGTLYDPATAVSKSIASALAMTALDTTNLRLTFTAPDNGIVLVRQAGVIHGGTASAIVLIGVLDGATVRGRVTPMLGSFTSGNIVQPFEALCVVTGLTAGASLTWDAAYGVEANAASSAIKYGGPNNTTVIDAWGGYAFEIYNTA